METITDVFYSRLCKNEKTEKETEKLKIALSINRENTKKVQAESYQNIDI